MQAQLSELQKKLYKGRVEQYTGVSNLSDSNGPTRNITKDHKQRSQRRKHLKTSLTYSNSAKNEKYIKNFSKKLFQTTRLNYFLETSNLYQPLLFPALINRY